MDVLGEDVLAEWLEESLGQHLIRAYALPTDTARIDDMTCYQVVDDQFNEQQVTPRSDLQRRILDLLGIPHTVYTQLAGP